MLSETLPIQWDLQIRIQAKISTTKNPQLPTLLMRKGSHHLLLRGLGTLSGS